MRIWQRNLALFFFKKFQIDCHQRLKHLLRYEQNIHRLIFQMKTNINSEELPIFDMKT